MDKILMTYVMLIKKGNLTLEQIPQVWREKVQVELERENS